MGILIPEHVWTWGLINNTNDYQGKNKNHVQLNGANSICKDNVLEIQQNLECFRFLYSKGIFGVFFSSLIKAWK